MEANEYHVVFAKLCASFKAAFSATGAEKAVLGISGGVDSALVAAVAARALGTEKLLLYFLPYKTSSDKSRTDAELLCKTLGAELQIADISPVADAFFSLSAVSDNLRKGNAMARIRMTFLFDKAKANNAIVLGTSNKSEALLGYGTLYGDTASSINVLGELYKKDVFAVAEAAGVPDSILSKPPTADLWPGQTDEGELGFSYAQADAFFYAALELRMDKDELYSVFGEDFSKAIAARVLKNSFKRRMPAICGVFTSHINADKIDTVFKKLVDSKK